MPLQDRIANQLDRAEELAHWSRDQIITSESGFAARQAIARRLGAEVDGDVVTFGFWTPEILDHRIPDGDVFLELLAPAEDLDLTIARQTVTFERLRLPVARQDFFTFAAVTGAQAGTRDRIGDFYCLAWRDHDGHWHRIYDPLAMSVPFGVFAPAEIYDTGAMQDDRADKEYFAAMAGETPQKIGPPTNILQIHVPTATAGGTIASLNRRFERLAERVKTGLPLEPDDQLYLGYDAVQLLPVEPTTVYETGPDFWQETEGEDQITVDLLRPDTTNWGYDIVISGMGTVNPVLLETGRPDELVDLAVTLHTFPTKSKMLIFDVVYGHSDNQGLNALNPHFFAGPNMYGQNMDYKNPNVRAIMLEMQRRKVNFGADAVRVDGAQDFKWWDLTAQDLQHDDEYLHEMAAITQEVAGVEYLPWFIFEDGRPWPQEDWELSSTYRAVIEQMPDTFQWGPLTFAHNTPFLYSFWLSKFWRIREMVEVGENWISGTANHDTLRRGTQVNPKLNVNTRLGDTRMEILDKAYDNPAVSMLTYAAFPGVPMDFLNATSRASWGFVRNQDDKYGVKVVSEEAISLKWQVDEYSYERPGNFTRLKAMGFETRADLARFFDLPALVEVTDYDLDEIARLLNQVEPPLAGPGTFSVRILKEVARAWMDDMHEYCNVANAVSNLDSNQTGYMLGLRNFRRENPWLRFNFGERDYFDYMRPIAGRTVFTSLRHGPDGQQIYTITHMEGGETSDFDPLRLKIPGLEGAGWKCAVRTPNIGPDYISGPIVMRDSMGLVFTRGL